MKNDKRKEFETLIALIGIRELTEEEFSKLNDFMKSEEGWAEEYYEHCHLHGMLQQKNGALPGLSDIEALIDKCDTPTKPTSKPVKQFPVWIIAAAACLILALVINFNQTKQTAFVAQLKTGLNYKLIDSNGLPVQIGDQLKGRYSLKEGLAELNYGVGVKVVLEAPAEIDILDPDTMLLSQGKVYALTPPGAKGFTITTPKAVFNDLGTEFAIECFDKKDTTLEVYQGKVQAITNEGLEKTLTAGQGLVLNRLGKLKDSAIREDYFVRELPTLTDPYQQLVTSLAPVVYLPMEANKQGAFYNYSAFSPSTVQADAKALVPGIVGKAFKCNQQNYLKIGAYPKTADFITVMGWFKVEDNSSGVIARNGEDKGQFSIYLENGILKAIVVNRHGMPVTTTLSDSLEDDKWYHIALVYDGAKVILYQDSKLTAAKTNYEAIYSENLLPYLSIGSGSSETLSFTGLVDEFAIFNKALSSQDIKALYKASQK